MPILNRLPRGGSGGSTDTGNKMNVFVQPTEPVIKEGIWIETNELVSPDILVTDTIPIDYNYIATANIPFSFSTGSTSPIAAGVCLFSRTNCYQYNISSNKYTKMTNIPYDFLYGSTSSIGNDVYLFGGSITNTSKYCYKYNNGRYTKMTDIPYIFYQGSTSRVGSTVYLFGGSSSATNCYKYNLMNTYTKMTDIPYAFTNGSTSPVGSIVYLFGGSSSATNCYKYDTVNNIYTKLLDIPYAFNQGSTSVIGNDVYLFKSTIGCYKYNTVNNTYTKLLDTIPISPNTVSTVGTDIYGFFNYNGYKFHESSPSFDDNTFIIIKTSEYDGLYQTQFYQLPSEVSMSGISRITSGFDDASLYIDNTDILSPMCYGDGEQWVKFKN